VTARAWARPSSARIAAQWGAASFAGSWQDGDATELLLVVTVDATQACAETSGSRMVEVPVRVRYGTSDHRVQDHETHAHVNVFRDGESVTQLQLVLSETLMCGANDTQLPQLEDRCSTFARAEAQLLINRESGGTRARERPSRSTSTSRKSGRRGR
jgi:hypothetical protein